ncbi:uncharacterized protein LOC115443884 [Manduca sexta]|uniref:uncharacterized protein LOC115443884 n=1 Tax=Manduca sexta TaxID=7130 RepID=UPI00188F8C5E|nr:uncharacterized protein LOC115443884 [Manduca sexta]
MLQKYSIFVLLYTYFIYAIICSEKNYGSVDVIITKLEVCKGPKRVDCTIETAQMTSNHSFKDTLSLKEDVNLTSGKIIGSQNGKDLIKYNMKNPCDNLLIHSLLKAYVNISDDCMISKGEYEYVVDVNTISQKFYHGVFFYGNWTFKTVLYSTNCNALCNHVDLLISQRKK